MLKSVFHGFFLCKKNIAVFALVLLFCLYEIVGLCKDGIVFVRYKLAEKGVTNIKNKIEISEANYSSADKNYEIQLKDFYEKIESLNREKGENIDKIAKLCEEIASLDEEVTELNQHIKAGQKLSNVLEKNKENLEESKKLQYYNSSRGETNNKISKLDDDISALNEDINAKDNEIKDKIKIQEDKNRQKTELQMRNNEIEKIIQVFNVNIENIKNDISDCEINYIDNKTKLYDVTSEKEELEKKYRKDFEERLATSRHLPFIIVLFLAIFLIVLFIIRYVYLENLKELNQEINRLLSN